MGTQRSAKVVDVRANGGVHQVSLATGEVLEVARPYDVPRVGEVVLVLVSTTLRFRGKTVPVQSSTSA